MFVTVFVIVTFVSIQGVLPFSPQVIAPKRIIQQPFRAFPLSLSWSEVTGSTPVDKELPPVILLHGLLGQKKNFGSWARDFVANNYIDSGRRMILVDLRNHGESPHDDDMTYDAMAYDVVHLLDNLGLSQSVIIGHSMGGKVAMAIAMLAPQRVAGLCVIDIAPVRYTAVDGSDWRLAESLVRELSLLPLATLRSKRDADMHLSRQVLDPQIRQFALMNLAEERQSSGFSRLYWRVNLDAIVRHLPTIAGAEVRGGSDIRPFNRPTLFIKGSASQYFKEESHLRRTKGLFPTAHIRTIAGAGHWIHVAKPTELHEEISTFLKELRPKFREAVQFAREPIRRVEFAV